MTDQPRLIEYAFPLKQASLDSVHEKNVRHGHISSLHIWPARRPLAACRAALIATLLPDPGTPEGRQELCERIGGKVVPKIQKKTMPGGKVIERVKEETEGGVLSWIGATPKSGSKAKKKEHQEIVEHREQELAWFREQIKAAYGGRAPRVLDPFSGGGAIPLEAMRLGCDATAIDINPVAWFILKCTLEYPQKLAGKTHPLPDFILEDEEFMAAFYKAHPHLVGRTKKTKKQKEAEKKAPGLFDKEDSGRTPRADLAWHVRAWGRWMLAQSRGELAPLYPTYADFEPLDMKNPKPYERREMQPVPLKDDGTLEIDALNAEFSSEYLQSKKNPRWVAKPVVAYLWARTVTCKHCRARLPLVKTLWLCKRSNKRVLLTMSRNEDNSGVDYGVRKNVPIVGGNAAQRREGDKKLGNATMSRAGAECPCCGVIMTGRDIQVEGQAGTLGAELMAVVTDGQTGKDYRPATERERRIAAELEDTSQDRLSELPYGDLNEPIPRGASRVGGGSAFTAHLYGLTEWKDVFTSRQRIVLASLINSLRKVNRTTADRGYSPEWSEAIFAYLTCGFDRMLDFNSKQVSWISSVEAIGHTFVRYALPITWDYSESAMINGVRGGWIMCLDGILKSYDTLARVGCCTTITPTVRKQSATALAEENLYDVVLTDPPYYDAIPYSDLMDYFYVWMRRALKALTPEFDRTLDSALGPKWNAETNDGELIDEAGRHDGDNEKSKAAYEDGMARVFTACYSALRPNGRFVVVFAHKKPDAWETLVSAIIRSGFVVDSSWPIQTEQAARMRAQSSAALASSVWLVCRKRDAAARPGWDNRVLEDMRTNIRERLREYWDAGIRGPDFVWAATGPAMEAYSEHPIVKKANAPGEVMTVGEFLSHVRRMVVDFVVGQVLTGDDNSADMAAADRMDAPTAYYLLHRHDFGLEEAPVGACILYSTACGISDRDLQSTWNLVSHKGGNAAANDENDDAADPDAESDDDSDARSGSKLQLKTWAQRKNRLMGYEAPGGQPVPVIDRVHRLLHLWKAGDVHKVDEYLDDNGLRRHELFKRLVQSLIELSMEGSEERKLLESLSNHIQSKGATPHRPALPFGDDD